METRVGAQVNKGVLAEECFREYFRNLGSFVLRGVPVREGRETVTDIDLWVYTRATAHIRHISIVDIKHQKRSKPFERLIWIKGLQKTLGADEAIIASKGLNEPAENFSEKVGVRVVTRSIFEAVMRQYSVQEKRLSAEELNEVWKRIRIGRMTLRSEMNSIKAEIFRGIDFRTLNTWLDKAASLVQLMVEREPTPGPITRGFYLCSALVAVAADYLGGFHSFSTHDSRQKFFREGMLFGRHDVGARKAYVEFAENAVTEFLDHSGASAARVRTGLEDAISKMPVQGLAEFFGHPKASRELWNAALALEESCYAKEVSAPQNLESLEAKKVIGLISDYANVPRLEVLGGSGQRELNLSVTAEAISRPVSETGASQNSDR